MFWFVPIAFWPFMFNPYFWSVEVRKEDDNIVYINFRTGERE